MFHDAHGGCVGGSGCSNVPVGFGLTSHQDKADFKPYLKQGESIKKACELVAEHGAKQLNRYKAMIEGA